MTASPKKCTKCHRDLLYILDIEKFYCVHCRETTTVYSIRGPGKNPVIKSLFDEELPDTGLPNHLVSSAVTLIKNRKKNSIIKNLNDNDLPDTRTIIIVPAVQQKKKPLILQFREENEI